MSSGATPSPCLRDVRASTAWVLSEAAARGSPAVSIDDAAIERELDAHRELYSASALPPSWAADYHFCDGTDLTAQYVLVLDACNFCFWPLEGYEYSDLAGSLKAVLTADPKAFDADKLANIDEDTLQQWLQPTPTGTFRLSQHPIAVARREGKPAPAVVPIPLLAQRTRAVRELGTALQRFFDGKAANLVRAAKQDAARLVELVVAHLPAFRDETLFAGRQVFLYKRAQILVGDLWGAFQGSGLGAFDNISELTCFADYRVPQLLRSVGIMRYSDALAAAVDGKQELPAGQSSGEVELRAATVQAVERMVSALQRRGVALPPFQLDWLLWERGEALLDKLAPHHRTMTIFY